MKLLACTITIFAALLASEAFGDIRLSDPLFRKNALCDYLIVSADDEGILEQAKRLARTKLEKGLKTSVVTVSEITGAMKGIDTQHKIRNFIKKAYQKKGITWVLLLGDLEKIPARRVSTGGMYFPYDTSSVYSDVYYACLDGEWDIDADGIYGNEQSRTANTVRCSFVDDPDGETFRFACEDNEEPGLDLWYDVYLGRLPASSAGEARVMVDKIIAYRMTPRASTYADDMVFLASQVHDLWSGFGTDVKVDDATYYWHYKVKPLFDDAGPFGAVDIDELYEDSVLEDGSVVNDSNEITYDMMNEYLSRGYNMVFFTFHGNPRGIRICSMTDDGTHKPDYLHTQVRGLRSRYLSNIMSISCSVMKMVEDSNYCFAKTFLTNPLGGAVSYTGASGIDYFNIRGRHYARSIEYLSKRGINRIAKAYQLANVKEFCRHNMFVHQHWGDPELELWTASDIDVRPLDVVVELVDDKYVVRVSPAPDSVLVCLYHENGIFERGYTSSGKIEFDAVSAAIDGIKVTASCHNYIPGSVIMNSQAVVARPAQPAPAASSIMRIAHQGAQTRIAFTGLRTSVQASLLTPAGRTVDQYNTNMPDAVWDVGNLPGGMYLVRARIGTKTLTIKFVVKR
ncbi:MAG: hypothetical protein GF418_10500 [Chitinivibrionales bacterium]|nr:hypothetical protein [Chitinivibrionales bacterium]MBD3396043.1 hypothetical protein [Chitinivibrionales bacterium]